LSAVANALHGLDRDVGFDIVAVESDGCDEGDLEWLLDDELHEHVKKVRTKTLVIKVFAKILCNLNRFVLWQLRGACDVEQEAAKLRERRFFVSAAWRIVISTSLGSTAVITAVVVAAVIITSPLVISSAIATSIAPILAVVSKVRIRHIGRGWYFLARDSVCLGSCWPWVRESKDA